MSKLHKSAVALTIGALGVVFGDIGTSPLYALTAVFGPLGLQLPVTYANVTGIISLIIWAVTIAVSIKFVGFIMAANNKGEGGVLALVALIKGSRLGVRTKWFWIVIGLIGVALFYGDSIITPAISVLSAVESMNTVTPSLSAFVIPMTVIVLTALFWIQKYGTDRIGKYFGPIMLIWFLVIGGAGAWQILLHPSILHALSPLAAISFFVHYPGLAFIAMTAVVLAITGAEALYADMGHFGRPPIARAWLGIVFPMLALCYMGQGALLLHDPQLTSNILIQLFPSELRIPILVLSVAATLIASQSVISGAFSLTRQAIQFDFLPKLLIRHTSIERIGQIYIPVVNGLLFVFVTLLVISFGSSANLANAYGVAVSGTLAID